MREILADLVAEQQSLDQLLQRSPDRDWKKKTPITKWTVQDTISHLAWTEQMGAAALNGDTTEVMKARKAESFDAYMKVGIAEGRKLRPQAVIEWWRFKRADVVEALSRSKATDRVEWFLGNMSVKTFATGRLMETWAHGLDIAETLDKEMEDTPRLRHVAWLGWATLPYAFEVAGLDYPETIRVELVGPGYARWVYGPEDSEHVVRGNAAEWCRVVVQRLKPSAAENLTAEGDLAQKALKHARAFV